MYEDFWPGPDSEKVGEVDGVPVYAPEYLRALYPAGDGVVILGQAGARNLFLAHAITARHK